MKSLNEVIISITNKCNLSCRMCDIPKIVLGELSTKQWQLVIDDAAWIGAHTIVFSGGEPLLRRDIFKLIAYARDKNMNACLTSNGAAIDSVCAKKLYQAGINVVNISIEGSEQEHDSLRGMGSYKKAIQALEHLQEQNIETTLAATVSQYNYNKLSCVLETAKQYKATTVRFQPFNNLFLKDESKGSDFFISKDQAVILQAELEKVITLGHTYGISMNPSSYLKQIPDYLSLRKTSASNGCQALWSSCPINARGDVFPCWVLTDSSTQIGNISKQRLIDIWNSSGHDKIRQSIIAKTCQGCLMSCYDKDYKTDRAVKDFLNKAKKAGKKSVWIRQKNKLLQNVRKNLSALSKKYAFYLSYRGSLKKIFIRGANARKRKQYKPGISKDEELRALNQSIDKAKIILKKAQVKYK